MQNSIVIFIFFLSGPEFHFLSKFGPKNQNCQSKLKFVTWANSNIQNSMLLFTFSVLERKHLFEENLVQKTKIGSLRWNLVSRLIQICRIQWWCLLFVFQSGNNLFGQIWSKKSNCQLKLKFGTQINSIIQNSMVAFTFSVLYRKHPFLLSLRPYGIHFFA